MLRAEGETAVITASRPSDCLTLRRASVSTDTISTLRLQFDDPFTSSVNGRAEGEPPEVWKRAVRHILCTYKPRKLEVHPGKLVVGITVQDIFDLGNGLRYDVDWDDRHHIFVIEWFVSVLNAAFVHIYFTILTLLNNDEAIKTDTLIDTLCKCVHNQPILMN